MLLKAERNEIATFGRKLISAGLTTGTGGNLSLFNRPENLIAISPSGIEYCDMQPEDIVILDLAGKVVEGRLKPSSELNFHLALYNRRPDIHAVVHTHSIYATTIACLAHCRTGDKIVASNTLYGGTHQLFQETLPRLGIEVVEVDATDAAKIAAAIDDRTRLVHVETPANPTLTLVDLEAVSAICRNRGVPLMVDNTFATPYLQRPLELGADIVLHSATKYIGGHGDTVAGVLVGTKEFIDVARSAFMRDLGPVISPFNSWLLLRGLKTLPVRMDKHCENAMEIAQYLDFHPAVEKVLYPGLRTHPQHALAKKQMRSFGGMVSFIVRGGREAGRQIMNRVKLWTLAVSLGDVDSLIEHPASMTHSTYNEEQLTEAGIVPGLVRLSVGLEDPEDLVDDLKQALAPLVRG